MMEDKIAYFDKKADTYFHIYHENSPGAYGVRVRKKRVLESIDRSGGKVLDVGCGPGIMVKELLDLGYEFWGVDASPNMIRECNKIFGNRNSVHFFTGDATDLKFPDKYFDLVICMGVIDRIENYELAIKEMLRVTKKGETLIIAFPNLYSPYAFWRAFIFYPIVNIIKSIYYSILRKPKPPSVLSSFVKLHSKKGASELVKKYFGEVTDTVYFYFNVFLSPCDEMFPYLTVWLTKKLERYCFRKLRWLGSAFILKIKKL